MKLACRSPDLNIDGQARKLLDDDDLHKGEVYGNFHVKYFEGADGAKFAKITKKINQPKNLIGNYSDADFCHKNTQYEYESIKVLRDHKIE